MKCLYPQKKTRLIKGIEYEYSHKCGDCVPCRKTRRAEWAFRILLESMLHEYSVFVTLTYDPLIYCGDDLVKEDLTKFLKKLRRRLDYKIRYFAVGEYGDKGGAPHYHLILFGVDQETIIQDVDQSWDYGLIDVALLNAARAAYCAGYVLKKIMTYYDPEDPREPEYSTMSRRPGLANGMVEYIALLFIYKAVKDDVLVLANVPTALRTEGRVFPIGNYLTKKALEYICINTWYDLPSEISVAILQERQHVLDMNISEYFDRSLINNKLKRTTNRKGDL